VARPARAVENVVDKVRDPVDQRMQASDHCGRRRDASLPARLPTEANNADKRFENGSDAKQRGK